MDELIYLEEANKQLASSCVISQKLYPVVIKAYDQNKNAVKKLIGEFITAKYSSLYATGPYEIIYFTKDDYDNFWKAIKLNENQILSIMRECFFYQPPFDKTAYNPKCVKAPFTAVMFCCIKKALKDKDKKMSELLTIYLAFSGQFYASIFSLFWEYGAKKGVMEYIVNNKLSGKFDLKRYGNVFSAVQNICSVWLNYYSKDILDPNLDDISYSTVVQQLHDREKSFLKNISKVYYENIDNYLNYTRNNLDPDNYMLQDNNSSLANKYTEIAVNYLVTRDINYAHCGMVADENVRKDEIKNIMSSILHNKDNISEVRELINIIITDFMKNYPEESLSSVKFLTYSMATKPNTKDKNLIREREIIIKWLTDNSVDYVRRKSRQSTATSYYKCVLKMIVLGINAAIK